MRSTATRATVLFCADQGALCLLPGFASAVEGDASLVLAAVGLAARERLHLPHNVGSLLRACAVDIAALPGRERGAALLDLLLAPDPAAAIDLAQRLGLLAALAPEAAALASMPKAGARYKDVYLHTLKVVAATPADPITRLAALLHDIAKPETLTIVNGEAHFPNHDAIGAERAARRLKALKFGKETVAAVELLVRLHLRANAYDRDWTDSAVRRLKHDAGDQWQHLLNLSAADVTSARQETVNRVRRSVQELAARAAEIDRPQPVAPLDGTALMERFDRGPGRWIGELKAHLLAMVENGALDPADTAAAWSAAEAFMAARGEK